MMALLRWKGVSLVAKKRGSVKVKLIKKAMKAIAKRNNLDYWNYHKITNSLIWNEITNMRHDRYIFISQISNLRKRLPKIYHEKSKR